VQSNSKNVQVLVAEKKSAWTDLDRVSFKKFSKSQSVEIEKLAWTGLGKVKKASSAASVFNVFLHDWLRICFDKRCIRCYTLHGCVLADVQSREELKMLLQAKRQPGQKMPGHVADRAYQMTRMTKTGYEKLKDKT
jgi:hypothetical protein